MIELPRAAHLWLRGYLADRLRHSMERSRTRTIDIMLAVADHFEPAHAEPGSATERARVRAWVDSFPRLARQFEDADHRPPRHTFFVPPEGRWREHVEALAELCSAGYGEVEVHLHHDRDTAENLSRTLLGFTRELADRYDLLSRTADGQIRYAFVHGNWALDNARPDGRWCGVNDEITVLRNTGCYADFTLPCAPDLSQARVVNSIYYAVDDPARPRSHDRGCPARVGMAGPKGAMLLIQGPLGLDWTRPRWGILPRLDNAAIDASNPPTLSRFKRWVDVGVAVRGRPEWVFVKLHTHGALEKNAAVLLGPDMAAFHLAIDSAFNDGERYRLHYVTAREMANIVAAAEAGETGNPGLYRDYLLTAPLRQRSATFS